MALGSSLRGRRARFHSIASWLGGFGLLALCACEPRQGAGGPPRASQALVLCARARALYDGRLAPSVDDVRALAEPVLQHRMALTFAARAEGMSVRDVIARLVKAQG